MVITYTPAQLHEIGEAVLLRECISRSLNYGNGNDNSHRQIDSIVYGSRNGHTRHEPIDDCIGQNLIYNNNVNIDTPYNGKSYPQSSSNHDYAMPNNDDHNYQDAWFLRFQQQLQYRAQTQNNHHMHYDSHSYGRPEVALIDQIGLTSQPTEHRSSQSHQLSLSVNELFEKVKSSNQAQPNRDPPRGRHLSEIEAELLARKDQDWLFLNQYQSKCQNA